MDQFMVTRNRQRLHTRGHETARVSPIAARESLGSNSDFYSTQFEKGYGNIRQDTTSLGIEARLGRHFPTIEELRSTHSIPRRNVNMKSNFTGRSIRGGGVGRVTSNSPCSQSGMDPDMIRGKSSQLNFEMHVSS